MSDEIKAQEQTVEQVPPAQETKPVDAALEERLRKLEEANREQKAHVTRLEQENATYRQIITERGQQTPVARQEQPAPNKSVLDAKIADLEARLDRGEITAEQAAKENLRLIMEAKEAGKQEAINELTGMYSREQQIQRSFTNIFQDAELQGMEKEWGDIAAGYLNAGVGFGYNLQQAEQYAKDMVKAKINALKSRFGSAPAAPKAPESPVAPAQPQVPAQAPSGMKGEGEGVKQPEKQDKPVTAEESQKSFIDIRRERMMRQRGA